MDYCAIGVEKPKLAIVWLPYLYLLFDCFWQWCQHFFGGFAHNSLDLVHGFAHKVPQGQRRTQGKIILYLYLPCRFIGVFCLFLGILRFSKVFCDFFFSILRFFKNFGNIWISLNLRLLGFLGILRFFLGAGT